MSIEINCSHGEILDKLSILDIKKSKIQDQYKLNQVIKEFDYLKSKVISHGFFYDLLLEINLKIWELQDKIRDSDVNLSYANDCFDIISLNDARFRIKNKINFLFDSDFKEQKGYNKKKCYFISNLGLNDQISVIGAVRYLSIFYDEINVISKDSDFENMRLIYSDDISIKISSMNHKNQIIELLDSLPKEIDIFSYESEFSYKNRRLHQFYTDKTQCKIHDTSIHKLYSDIKISFINHHKFFHIQDDSISDIMDEYKIVFIHESSDFDYSCYHREENLIINTSKNFYNPKDGEKFLLANKYIDLPIVKYISIIKISVIIDVIDDYFARVIFPLSLRKELKAIKKICRGNQRYDAVDPTFEYII